jgi:tetratricopeptide (TPR) repeat protein
MSNGSGDGHDRPSHRQVKLGTMRRLRRWWYGSAYRSYARVADRLYEWWHPKSTSGRSYYSYGRSRRNRLRRAWSHFWRWVARSPPARAWRHLLQHLYEWWHPVTGQRPGHPGRGSYGYYGRRRRSRAALARRRVRHWWRETTVAKRLRLGQNAFIEWWYPLVPDPHGYAGAGYYGRRRRSRAVLARRRVRHWWRETTVAKRLRLWQNALIEWWYPLVPDPHGYASYGYYGHRRRSRLAIALSQLRQRWRHSRAGRAWRHFTVAAWEWWYPEPDAPSGAGYYGRGRRVSRPVRFVKRAVKWFRRTWLGRKLRWLLDDLENFAFYVACRFRDDFAWWRIRHWLLRWQTWVLLACLVTATGFGYKYGVPQYHALLERQYAQQAQLWLKKGDLVRAVLRARQTLSLNPTNAIATRVFGDVADFYNSPYAVYWRQRAVLFTPNSTNRLALAYTALKFEGFPFPTATKALGELPPEARATATFHLIAGAMAVKMRDLAAAERHYAEALKLSPNDAATRMSLAVVRLHSKDPKVIKDSRTTLELLRTDRSVGLLALRSLAAESIDRGELDRAETLSKQVLTNAQASFSDRILHLAILKIAKRSEFQDFLKESQEKAGRNPFRIGELAAWMNSSGHARETVAWFNSLPREVIRQGLLPISLADAHAALGAWKELEGYLLSEPWEGLDHVRFAMLALAAWRQAGGHPQPDAWNRAVQLASVSPQAMSTLAELAGSWGWATEAEDVLWRASEKFANHSWPLQTLEQFYTARRDTAGLRRIYAARLMKDPDDRLARNNYAMVSLLVNNDVARAHQAAAELHATEPQNAVFTSTYAFSLHRQGRTKEAIELLRALGLDKLDDPSLALYYGVVLAADGQAETAQPYLKRGANAFMLPEEMALLRYANARP